MLLVFGGIKQEARDCWTIMFGGVEEGASDCWMRQKYSKYIIHAGASGYNISLKLRSEYWRRFHSEVVEENITPSDLTWWFWEGRKSIDSSVSVWAVKPLFGMQEGSFKYTIKWIWADASGYVFSLKQLGVSGRKRFLCQMNLRDQSC